MRRRVFGLSPMMKAKAVQGRQGCAIRRPTPDVVGGDSLGMEPAQSYRWVISPGHDFEFTARGTSVDGTDRAVLTIWDWENRRSRRPASRYGLRQR